MSTIEIDPAILHALTEVDFRLYALAGEAPTAPAAPARAAAVEVFVPVSAATPEPGDAAIPLFRAAARYGTAEPSPAIERERALGPSFPPDA
jgi:hypothetical protein